MYQKIMVPLDGSELAECVLPHVEAIASGCNAGEVLLVRVVEPLHLIRGTEYGIAPEERQRLETDSMNVARQYLDKVKGQLKNKGIAVKAEVLFGKADEKLIELAKSDVDLIIIASHGRSGISRWVWGSVADRILRGACLPVMMIRAPGCYPGI